MELEPGEHIIFQGHPSWRSILGFYIKGSLLVAIAAAMAGGATQIANDEVDTGLVTLVAIVLLVVVLVAGWVKRLFTTYTISTTACTSGAGSSRAPSSRRSSTACRTSTRTSRSSSASS